MVKKIRNPSLLLRWGSLPVAWRKELDRQAYKEMRGDLWQYSDAEAKKIIQRNLRKWAWRVTPA